MRPDAGLDQAPQGHPQLARQRDHPDPAKPATAGAQALLRPPRQRPRRLTAAPAPGDLDGPGADVVLAGFGDAPLVSGVPTHRGGGRQAAQGTACLPMANGPPAAALQDQAPSTRHPQPVAQPQWRPVVRGGIRGRLEHGAAFGFSLGHALGQRLDVLPLLAETVSEARRERGSIPQAERLSVRRAVPARGQHQALRGAPPREAVADPRPIRCRRRQGAMPVTAVFCLHPGDTHATPHPLCPSDLAEEPGEPLRHREAVRRRSTGPPMDFTAGGVDDAGLPPLRHSPAGEPAPLPAGLVTTDNAGVIRASNAPLGPDALLSQAMDVPGWHRACSWPLRHPGRDATRPGRDAKGKGQQQDRPGWRGLIRRGRRGGRQRSTPSCVVQPLGA
jgi:hypothetical protein